jgi:hypothetical protein
MESRILGNLEVRFGGGLRGVLSEASPFPPYSIAAGYGM